jgi:hypothetical protein
MAMRVRGLPKKRDPFGLQANFIVAVGGGAAVGIIGGIGALVNGFIVIGLVAIPIGVAIGVGLVWYLLLPVDERYR